METIKITIATIIIILSIYYMFPYRINKSYEVFKFKLYYYYLYIKSLIITPSY